MYIPKPFEVTEKHRILAFIKANAFGQLISRVDGRLFASHIPFLIGEDGCSLSGHLARENPQWKSIESQEVLVTFEGPHAYISPTWYNSPGVPTWNYQAVHVYARCKVTHDTDRLKQLVEMLSDSYESGSARPWVPDYSPGMLRGIVGLELEITDLQCTYKLSQNRPKADRQNVVDELEKAGLTSLASAMGEAKP